MYSARLAFFHAEDKSSGILFIGNRVKKHLGQA